MSGRSNLASSLLLLADQRVEHDDEGEQVEVHQEAELQEHGGNSALVGRQLAPQLRLSVSTPGHPQTVTTFEEDGVSRAGRVCSID